MFLDDGTLLVFPSINIGGLKWRGIRNSRWDIEMMQIFNRYKCSVQPLALYGNNSYLFYFFQHFITRFSSNFLKREIFVRKNDTVEIKISKPIQADAFNGLKKKALVRCIKKHILLLSRGKQEFFKTMTPVIHPVDCRLLRKEVFKSEMLGFTEDHKLIIITSFDQSPNTMKEIGRLRETTFRYMGEGTGNRKDIDEYDEYYKHIILWDDVDMEIVGSYRLGLGSEIINGKEKINQRMYTRSLFDYNDKINPYLANAIECGRSFVQKKYWNSRALDYLWHGIGAYLAKYPEIKYLFGPVSIPSNYSPEAKDLIIYYYKKWYSPKISFVKAKLPYFISGEKLKDLSDVFDANNVKDDFLILRKQLKFLGYTVPTLFKQYTDLCVEGGVYFHDFSVDPLFGHCVDGFIFLELSKVEEKKKSRYIKSKLQGDKQEPTIHSLFEGQSK